MPLCISCRGEYWVPPEESKKTEMLAKMYGWEELPSYVCARCGQSNERWHEWVDRGEVAHFVRFFASFWGLQALISIALPILAALTIDFTSIASENIGIPLAILLSVANIALLYSLRDSLWRYDLRARVGRGLRPPLALLAIIAFGLALLFGLAIVMMLEVRATTPEVEPTEGLVRVVTTIMLALTFVNVTFSAMLMAADTYGGWLNHEMPQPIYAQERRLLGVIEDALRSRQETGATRAAKTTITDLERTPDAGVILMLSVETEDKQESDQGSLMVAQNWHIEADQWGRVIRMKRAGAPQYTAIEKSSDEAKAEADEDKGVSEGEPEPAMSGEVLFKEEGAEEEGPVGETYKTRSATTISITSSRKHWVA